VVVVVGGVVVGMVWCGCVGWVCGRLDVCLEVAQGKWPGPRDAPHPFFRGSSTKQAA
jgi:hypothetical protein